jgi:glycosyltransferase involved in cell wall biosynthesis
MRLSVVINTLNEEHNIRECLETVKWADEIVIVDMYSDDKTVEIAKEYTEKIYFHERVGYSDPARNFAVSKATGDWIFVVSADERVTESLRSEICALLLNEPKFAAYRIYFQEYMFGKLIHYGTWQFHKHVRLHKVGCCDWPTTVHTAPIIKGEIGDLQGVIEHYSHLTIGHFMNKLNTYTTIEAKEWFDNGVRKSLLNCFYYGMGKFLKELIYYRGYKDGAHGVILAALYGIYYFTARVKLWELWYKFDRGIEI